MKEIIRASLFHGRLKVEVSYKSIWPQQLNLEVLVGDTIVETLPVTRTIARGGEENALLIDLPLDGVIAHHAVLLRLRRGSKVLEDSVLQFRASDRDNRPIVVSNRRPEGLRLQGWVIARPDQEVRVSLFVDGQFVESTPLTTTRRDITQLYPETANTKNGYGAGIPEWCYDGQPHEFVFIEEHGRVIAENSVLTLSSADLREGLLRRSHILLKLLSNGQYEDQT